MKAFIRLTMAATSTLSITATASAAQPVLVVAIQYQIRENNVELLEEMVATPLMRALKKLERVEEIKTMTNHGRVDAEVHFEGEASDQDLIATTKELEQLEFDAGIQVTFRTIELRARSNAVFNAF